MGREVCGLGVFEALGKKLFYQPLNDPCGGAVKPFDPYSHPPRTPGYSFLAEEYPTRFLAFGRIAVFEFYRSLERLPLKETPGCY